MARREVLHGRPWSVIPMRVVADTGDLLALLLAEGTPLEFAGHPFGPHPWSFTDRWLDTDVLQLHRAGDAYAVWGFFRDDVRSGWYVNFQRPLERRPGAVDTLDHGVDIVVAADGRWRWKDLDDVAGQVADGRLTAGGGDRGVAGDRTGHRPAGRAARKVVVGGLGVLASTVTVSGRGGRW